MNDMIDMSQFVEAKSDQLCADDLTGNPRVITVRRVTGNDGDQPVSIYFDGDNNKPFKPCKTMRRVLLAVWGRNAADYVGRSMRIYRDDSVQFGGLNVGGIRISHMSHIDKKVMVVVMKTKGKKAPIEIEPLKVETAPAPDDQMSQWTARFVAAVAAFTTPDEVNAHAAKQAKWLDKLPADLRGQCDAAVNDRLAELLPGEGKPDDAFGEQNNDDAVWEG